MKRAFIGLAVLVLIGLAAFALTRPPANDQKAGTDSLPSNSPAASTSTAPGNTDESSTTIEYTASGFSPSTLTVKSGTTVTIKNTSGRELDFHSDPHPQHTDNPELNVDDVEMGESKTFEVTTKGTFGYHNHVRSSDRGTIVVQ